MLLAINFELRSTFRENRCDLDQIVQQDRTIM